MEEHVMMRTTDLLREVRDKPTASPPQISASLTCCFSVSGSTDDRGSRGSRHISDGQETSADSSAFSLSDSDLTALRYRR